MQQLSGHAPKKLAGADVATYPGYIRLVLKEAGNAALSGCRRFVALCHKEGGERAMIVAAWRPSDAAHLEAPVAAAAHGLMPGFRLAVVAPMGGAAAASRAAAISRTPVNGMVRIFRSEHQAAAWLMR